MKMEQNPKGGCPWGSKKLTSKGFIFISKEHEIRKGSLRRSCRVHLRSLKQLGNAVAIVFHRLTGRKRITWENSHPKTLALPCHCPAVGPSTYMPLISFQTPSRADFSGLWDASRICFAVFNKAPSMKHRLSLPGDCQGSRLLSASLMLSWPQGHGLTSPSTWDGREFLSSLCKEHETNRNNPEKSVTPTPHPASQRKKLVEEQIPRRELQSDPFAVVCSVMFSFLVTPGL